MVIYEYHSRKFKKSLLNKQDQRQPSSRQFSLNSKSLLLKINGNSPFIGNIRLFSRVYMNQALRPQLLLPQFLSHFAPILSTHQQKLVDPQTTTRRCAPRSTYFGGSFLFLPRKITDVTKFHGLFFKHLSVLSPRPTS